MKIVRPICCGMDVHKNLIVATIGITDSTTRVTEYIQEDFSTLNTDLFRLKAWLKAHDCFDACMESTGEVFKPSDIESFKNPKLVQSIKLTPDIALQFLQQSGYDVSSIQAFSIS